MRLESGEEACVCSPEVRVEEFSWAESQDDTREERNQQGAGVRRPSLLYGFLPVSESGDISLKA